MIDREFLAIWGAGLSTLLAMVKVWEIWSSRRRIEVSYSFVGNPEEGNDIIIRNISGKPFIVTYWELLFCERKHFRWISYRTEEPGEHANDICIQGHSSKKFNFSEADYFEWGHQALAGKRIYLKLQIAGERKPVTYLVYKA